MTVQLPAGIQHGTPQGYAAGCRREKDCPALHEHGMCCLYAHVRSITDIRYHRAHARDPRPAAIARALGIRTPGYTERLQNDREAEIDQEFNDRHAGYVWRGNRAHRKTATPTPELTPKETPMPTPNDVAKTSKPLTVEPTIDTTPTQTPDALAEEQQPTPKKRTGHTPPPSASAGLTKTERAKCRAWAAANGHEVGTAGRIPRAIVDAWLAARTDTTAAPTDDCHEAACDYVEPHKHGFACGRSCPCGLAMQPAEVELDDAPVEGGLVLPGYLEPVLAHGVELGVIEPEEFDEAMRAARERAELVELNRDADGEPDLPAAIGQQGIVEAHLDRVTIVPEPAGPRPEWADITIPEDIERARALAVRLEQELAHTEEQLATAHAALDTTLAKWNADTAALQQKITQLTVDLRAALQTASIWSGLYHDTSNELMRHRLRDEEQLARALQDLFVGDARREPITYAQPARRRLFDVTTWFGGRS